MNGKENKSKPRAFSDGRPHKLDDNLKKIMENLAIVQCSVREIAIAIGVHEDTLYKNKIYSSIIEKGREKGKTRLRTAMFKAAMNGNIVMQIFLSKQMLGYSDKATLDMNNKAALTLNYKLPDNKQEAITAEYVKNEEDQRADGEEQ